jgi:CubicO group peptidase (beta-lactamase class C family)
VNWPPAARGLAEVFNWAINQDGISGTVLNDFSKVQVYGHDQVLDQDNHVFGTLFMKPTSVCPFGSENAYGHDGAAGVVVFVDPKTEIILAYTVRRMTSPGGLDPRSIPVINKLAKFEI